MKSLVSSLLFLVWLWIQSIISIFISTNNHLLHSSLESLDYVVIISFLVDSNLASQSHHFLMDHVLTSLLRGYKSQFQEKQHTVYNVPKHGQKAKVFVPFNHVCSYNKHQMSLCYFGHSLVLLRKPLYNRCHLLGHHRCDLLFRLLTGTLVELKLLLHQSYWWKRQSLDFAGTGLAKILG